MNPSDPHPFRVPGRLGNKPSDPESLFRSLSRRASHVQHLWAHQADVLRSWHSTHVDTPDLALELPTGTGKTLIGLLIGDFVRQTREERVAYLCPNRQLAYQAGALADDYSIDARVLVGSQASYNPDDINAFEDSSAVAITTYSAIFNTNPRMSSANLLILDDAHASEDFIASLWNVEVHREDSRQLYFSLIDFFKDVIPGSQLWNFKNESSSYARSECTKIPSPVAQKRETMLRDFLDSALEKSDLAFPWRMIRAHLEACHIYITWSSISIRPIIPPTFGHAPFANARQRIYMSATLGAGGELERITGVRQIEKLAVPEGWDREGTGRRLIIFPDRSLPPDTAHDTSLLLAGEATRSLILTPSKHAAQSISKGFKEVSPTPQILSASDIEHSLDSFLQLDHAALVLHNRYDGLDLPGDACHVEWLYGLPGATNAQETFLLNRLGIHALLRDRITTRLTQALGRCTRNATDHALVIISGPRALDFCIKSENRQGLHPELRAEMQYGLEVSQVAWPQELIDPAHAFLEKQQGWEEVEQWIRDERDAYPVQEDSVAQILMANVRDEVDYACAIWVSNYQLALAKARACADRLIGNTHAEYRAWWYYLAGSAAALSVSRDNALHLHDTVRELFARACSASPRLTWFREAIRKVDVNVVGQPIDDELLLDSADAIERRIQDIGIAGTSFESEAQAIIEQLDNTEAKPFEQGLERLGTWLGLNAVRPTGPGVPDGVWPFGEETIVAFEAKTDEQPSNPISLSTAREAQGHKKWVEAHMQPTDSTAVVVVVISDRTTIANEALPNAEGLFVVSPSFVRKLGGRVVTLVRGVRAEASEIGNEEFRAVIANRLKQDGLSPKNILTALQVNPLGEFPTRESSTEKL